LNKDNNAIDSIDYSKLFNTENYKISTESGLKIRDNISRRK